MQHEARAPPGPRFLRLLGEEAASPSPRSGGGGDNLGAARRGRTLATGQQPPVKPGLDPRGRTRMRLASRLVAVNAIRQRCPRG